MLENVKRVEVTPALFSRIEKKIQVLNQNHIDMKMVWLSAAALGLLVLLNISLVSSWPGQDESPGAYSESILLSTTENLYDE